MCGVLLPIGDRFGISTDLAGTNRPHGDRRPLLMQQNLTCDALVSACVCMCAPFIPAYLFVCVSVYLCVIFRCVCPEGFEGDQCEINIDDCEDNDCENNSTCVDGINNYTCMCSPEYTGNTAPSSLFPVRFSSNRHISISEHRNMGLSGIMYPPGRFV